MAKKDAAAEKLKKMQLQRQIGTKEVVISAAIAAAVAAATLLQHL
jgi:hypothetical protein